MPLGRCIFHSIPCLGVALDMCMFNSVRNCQTVIAKCCTTLNSELLCIRVQVPLSLTALGIASLLLAILVGVTRMTSGISL